MSAAARDALKSALAQDAKSLMDVQGLYLGGSFGRGIADDWSDLDYIAVADPGRIPDLVEAWRDCVGQHARIVHQKQRVFPTSALINLITDEWVRCDLVIDTPERFAQRAKDRVTLVFERVPLFDALPVATPIPPVRSEALTGAVEEFLRILGLAHLAMHRGDLFTLHWGAALMRDQCRLFVLAMEPEAGLSGALTVAREVSAKRMAFLNGLPVAGADMAAALEAQADMARQFLPLARQACAEHGAAWPKAFIDATARVLRGVMPDPFCDWLEGQAA